MPSNLRRYFFILMPPPYPPNFPPLANTLWQGIIIGIGFLAFALPAARLAFELPALVATS